ncbi:hypothetical protein BHYA_0049g00290 [Botrytis hyacinthi]|uniref:BTB domain-containing protein n=1 Tax=Botrytis hyacinthi TaxID=278943 RepID=A0A4Z1H316_9HELO|nr:hypothetical protein BHYA_0049g00290 [Botrytis hyacinthi]
MSYPQVVKFSISEQKPDTRITLFQFKELHVHSSILKLYSAYFRRFMDSPDKVPAPSGAKWKYDWIGEAEEDGSWFVVAKTGRESKEQQQDVDLNTLSIEAFENIIMSMYQNPYEIKSTAHLQDITTLADFYCCLPVVSNSLYSAFYRSPNFLANIKKDREILLELSYKLRHRELFNDCLILISGHWHPDKLGFETKITDPKLANLAENMYNRMGTMMAHTQQKTLKPISIIGGTQNGVKYAALVSGGSLPKYHRFLQSCQPYLKEPISDILKNKLKLDPSAVAGEGEYSHNFLCIEVNDSDIPWDITQTDW